MRGPEPEWLPLALATTRGLGEPVTVLIADHRPDILPQKLRRVILLGGATATFPPEITVSRPEDWTYPRESSAD